MKKIFLVTVLLVLLASFPVYADSLVRVQCEDEDAGAEVFLNDKFVGECPVDAPVNEGTVQLRARKMVDVDHEKVFEKKLRVVEGVSQRVELIMSAPRLIADAKFRKQAAEAAAQLSAAEAGDIAAMIKMAERYEAGTGVKKDPAQAEKWRNKAGVATAEEQLRAANAGDINAMKNIAARYEAGHGVSKDSSQAQLWHERADTAKREKQAEEAAANREKSAREKAQDKKDRSSAVSFSEYTSKLVDGADKSFIHGNPISITITGFPLLIIGAVTDIIAAPSKSTELLSIRNEAALRPSTWGRPDSMIAQAARQDKASSLTAMVAAAR